jgi:uncharacterized membrane protein
MNKTSITYSDIQSFATTVALIIPLLIIAILVDSSKSAERIGPVGEKERSDKVSVRQSRRTLLAIGIGVVIEINSLAHILTGYNNDIAKIATIEYVSLIFTGLGTLVILYIVFIPHVELHISNIRKDAGTVRWSLIVGWLVDAAFLVTAIVDLSIGGDQWNYIQGYAFLGVFFAFTGSMATLTIFRIRSGNHKGPKGDA